MKARFTREQHQSAARVIRASRNALHDLCNDVSRAFPHGSPQVRALVRAIDAIGAARNQLDNAFFDDVHPAEGEHSPYYGAEPEHDA